MFVTKIILILSLYVCLAFNAYSQVDLRVFELAGTVMDENRKGIENVPVTNGINITLTDANGEYKLACNSTCQFVYITVPAGYEIPVHKKVPHFYQSIDKEKKNKQKYNFSLKKLPKADNKHAVIVWADPQVNFADELPIVQKAANNVASLVKEKYPDIPVHGIVCGDIIQDPSKEPRFYDPIKEALHSTGVPF